MDVNIRPATIEDLAATLAIYNFEVINATSTLDVKPLGMAAWGSWFEDHTTGNHCLLVAEANGQVVGYAGYGTFRAKEAYAPCVELSIYLDAGVRGQGVASQLMEALLEQARTNADVHTVVSVITSDNVASIKLHEKFGFETIGELREVGFKHDVWLDSTYMQLMV